MRQEDKRFYASDVWRRLRAYMLATYPLCQCDECKATGRLLEAKHVHHIKPRKERPDLALDPSNLLCVSHACHSRIEARKQKAHF